MKEQDKRAWIQKIGWDCYKALLTLEAAKKQATSSYDRRTRMIEQLQKALFVKETDEAQTEMFEPADFLTPELKTILEDPVGGL